MAPTSKDDPLDPVLAHADTWERAVLTVARYLKGCGHDPLKVLAQLVGKPAPRKRGRPHGKHSKRVIEEGFDNMWAYYVELPFLRAAIAFAKKSKRRATIEELAAEGLKADGAGAAFLEESRARKLRACLADIAPLSGKAGSRIALKALDPVRLLHDKGLSTTQPLANLRAAANRFLQRDKS